MTKDEIIDPRFESLTVDMRKAIGHCMEEYAKQQAIAFCEVVEEKYQDTLLSTEQLYELFLKSQQ